VNPQFGISQSSDARNMFGIVIPPQMAFHHDHKIPEEFPPDVYEYKRYFPKVVPRDSNFSGGVDLNAVEHCLKVLNGGLESSVAERWKQSPRNPEILKALENDLRFIDIAMLQCQIASRIDPEVVSALNLLLVLSVNDAVVIPIKDCLGLVRTICDLILNDLNSLEQMLNESKANLCAGQGETNSETTPFLIIGRESFSEKQFLGILDRIMTTLLVVRNWSFVDVNVPVLSSLVQLQEVFSRTIPLFFRLINLHDKYFPFLTVNHEWVKVEDISAQTELVGNYASVHTTLIGLQHCLVILSNLSLTFELQVTRVKGDPIMASIFDLALFFIMWPTHWFETFYNKFHEKLEIEEEADYHAVCILTNLLISSELIPHWNALFTSLSAEFRISALLLLVHVLDFVGVDRNTNGHGFPLPNNRVPQVYLDMGLMLIKHLLHMEAFVSAAISYWTQVWHVWSSKSLRLAEEDSQPNPTTVRRQATKVLSPVHPMVMALSRSLESQSVPFARKVAEMLYDFLPAISSYKDPNSARVAHRKTFKPRHWYDGADRTTEDDISNAITSGGDTGEQSIGGNRVDNCKGRSTMRFNYLKHEVLSNYRVYHALCDLPSFEEDSSFPPFSPSTTRLHPSIIDWSSFQEFMTSIAFRTDLDVVVKEYSLRIFSLLSERDCS
jgi:hypothetical protein